MDVDPDFIRLCAVVLAAPEAAPRPDMEACRLLLADAAAQAQSITWPEAFLASTALVVLGAVVLRVLQLWSVRQPKGCTSSSCR